MTLGGAEIDYPSDHATEASPLDEFKIFLNWPLPLVLEAEMRAHFTNAFKLETFHRRVS